MMTKSIKKDDIKSLLKEAVSDWNTYVPQRYFQEDVLFQELPKDSAVLDEALSGIALGDENVVISPKDIFFPQLETMFEFDGSNVKETAEASPKLLFGVKSCDLQGILFADDFFKRTFEDKYYLSRIQGRLVVVIGCLKPPRPDGCFCTSAKTGPFAENGYDLQLVDSGGEYLVEVGSKKGEEFISKFSKFFKDFSGNAGEAIGIIKQKAADSVSLKVDFEGALGLMADSKFIPEEKYSRIAERCIYCGACLYTCPTCTCFNVFDQMKDQEGERCRNWDGCVFEGYTRETSGHNPREKKWVRTARRYEHKLRDDLRVAGRSGCVGCGRCLTSCPVNIGMSKFIQELTEKRSII